MKKQSMIKKKFFFEWGSLTPNSKASAVRLIAGVLPIQARLAKLKLRYLARLLTAPPTFLPRRVAIGANRPGFESECRALCETYAIPFPTNITYATPKLAVQFRSCVSRAIASHHRKTDLATLTASSHGTILRRLFSPTCARHQPLDIFTTVL